MSSYDAFIKQLTNPRYLRRDLRVADIKGPKVPKVGVPRVTYKDGDIVGLDPMSTTTSNENIIPGGALPLTGAIAATQLPNLVDKIDPNVLNKMMWTPAGIVLGPEAKEEAKPKIETLPVSEKQKTSTVTEIPEQLKTDAGFIPPVTDTKIPGLKPDTGEDTSILKQGMDPEKKEKIVKTYDELKEKLERIPFVSEIEKETGIPGYTIKYYLDKLEYPLTAPSASKRIKFESFEEFGDVSKPTYSQSGVKWPSKEDKEDYKEQIVNRYKFAQNSAEVREKKRSGELLTNEQLAEKYGISTTVVKRINKQIVKEYDLEDKPVIGRAQTVKERSERRQGAIRIFSDSNFEQKVRGDLGVHLGHMSDLYNRTVKAETLGYAPNEINTALADTIDSVIKNINKAQEKLIKEKPEGWKEKLEEYNIKGMNYAALSKGYKIFEVTDPDTLEKKPINVQYGKIIDPTGIYEGRSIKDIAKETNLTELNKIERAFSQSVRGEKVTHPDLLTEDNFKKLRDYKLFEINRKSVLKTQSEIPRTEREKISKDIVDYRKFKFNKGGRVGLKLGGEPTGMYYQEIPDVDPEINIQKQIMNEDDPIRVAALEHRLEMYRKKQAQEEKQREEYKQQQKQQGVKYLEDFPTQGEYFKESAKQIFTNPAYFYSKGLKGAVEGTEWLVGQPAKILFNQKGENWDWYHPVGGEKLGINSLIQKYAPKEPTTLTEAVGTAAEIGGTFVDPFLLYGIGKGAVSGGIKSLPTEVKAVEETVDPTRRDLVKLMGVGATAAVLGPTLSKFSKIKTPTRVAKTIAVQTSKAVDNMPEFFPYLSELSLAKGKNLGDYMRSGMTEFKREITIPLEIAGKKTDITFKAIHDPAEGNVFFQYTNPLTGEDHAFDFFTGKTGKQRYGIDPEIPNASELYSVEVESPGFQYKVPDRSDPYRKSYDLADTATEADEVVVALDKWYKGLSKEEKTKFESKFKTHDEIHEELPGASWENQDENYPIMDFMYTKKKND